MRSRTGNAKLVFTYFCKQQTITNTKKLQKKEGSDEHARAAQALLCEVSETLSSWRRVWLHQTGIYFWKEIHLCARRVVEIFTIHLSRSHKPEVK